MRKITLENYRLLFLALALFFVAGSGISYGQDVPAAERAALVDLYNSTDGDNWTKKTNWNSGNPVSTWFGVTVSGGHVKVLTLPTNGLSGPIPASFGDLTSLTRINFKENELSGDLPASMAGLNKVTELYIQDNQLTGALPAMPALKYVAIRDNQFNELPNMNGIGLVDFWLYNNNFEFDDLELNKNAASRSFNYSPQGLVGTASAKDVATGGSITLTAEVGGTNNVYSWKKDGAPVGGNSKNLTISNAEEADEGDYVCTVTNTSISGLTLTYATITLTVTEGGGGEGLEVLPTTNILTASATLNGEVDLGSETVISKGFLYGTTPGLNFETADFMISKGADSEVFSETITGLSAYTDYYVKVFAYTATSVEFSTEKSFKTHSVDRALLIDLYNDTDGENWSNAENWLTDAPIGEWEGVTVVDGRVTGLDISGQGASGIVPDLAALTELAALNLSDNLFVFTDLVNVTLTTHDFAIFHPQAMVGDPVEESKLDVETLVLDAPLTGAVEYQWQILNGDVWEDLPGATGLTYTVTELVTSTFRVVMTKPADNDLILYSNTYSVDMYSEKDILVEFFFHHGGPNWVNQTNWNSAADLDNWHGVTTDGTYVIAIDLSYFSDPINSGSGEGNNLTGELFPGLAGLKKLEVLNLNGNSITGAMPAEWSALTELSFLDLGNNEISGSIPDSWSNLTNLVIFAAHNNQLSGYLGDAVTHWILLEKLIIDNNEIEDIPNIGPIFDKIANPKGGPINIQLQDNRLEFDDLQGISPGIILDLNEEFRYADQKINTNIIVIEAIEGEEITLLCQVGGIGLTYEWSFNGAPILPANPDYAGQGTNTLTFNSSDPLEGDYLCTVTNGVWSLLTLFSPVSTLNSTTLNLNASIPNDWYISVAIENNEMQNKIVVPTLVSEFGLGEIIVFSNTNNDDFGTEVGRITLDGSIDGYSLNDPNSDPGTRPYEYAIKVSDNLDTPNVSDLSDQQTSVHLSINLGLNGSRNLFWTEYLSAIHTVQNYEIFGSNSLDLSSMTSLAVMPSSMFTYTDFGTYKYYMVETIFQGPIPGMKSGEFRSVSNIFSTDGMPSLPDKNDIWIYPNPTSNEATFLFENPDNKPFELRVTDLTGKIWKQKTDLTSNQYKVQVNDLPPGLYIVQFIGDHTFIGKLLVE